MCILLKCFKPILITARATGMLSTTKTNDSKICKNCYIVFIAQLYSALVIYSFFNVISPITGQFAVLHATDWIQTICGYVASLCFFYKGLSGRKKLGKIFIAMDQVDKTFSIIGIKFNYSTLSRNLWIQIIFSAMFIFGAGSTMWIVYSTDFWLDVIMCVLYTCPLYLVYYNLILFSNIIFQIYLKYQKINSFLVKIKNEHSNFSTIYKITKCYEEINEVVMMANDLFGLTNLMSITISFVSITCQLYMIFVAYGQTSTEYSGFIVISCWMIVGTVPLALIAGICHVTMAEAEKSVYILHMIIFNRFDHFGDDLDLVALQLFHQKIEFTANGFFTIDMTLIYAVIGAVTTYLVILLQFNNGVSMDIAEDQLESE